MDSYTKRENENELFSSNKRKRDRHRKVSDLSEVSSKQYVMPLGKKEVLFMTMMPSRELVVKHCTLYKNYLVWCRHHACILSWPSSSSVAFWNE